MLRISWEQARVSILASPRKVGWEFQEAGLGSSGRAGQVLYLEGKLAIVMELFKDASWTESVIQSRICHPF